MFQAKQTFAINLSDFSLEALELERQGVTLVIKNQSRFLLNPGIIEDGKIVHAQKLREAVKQLLQQAKPNPIIAHDVAITLPESKIFAQTYALPKTFNAHQVPSALFSQARETMPIDVSLAAADFREIRRGSDTISYLFAATYSSLVEEYVSFFKSLQLKVTLITMESLALGAASVDDKKDETVLMLDIGARTTIASIFCKGELCESINVNIAGNNITAALAEKMKISIADAEQRKIETGMKAQAGDGAEMLIIQGQVQPLKDELLVFTRYYERKTGGAIDRVLLSGGTAALFGLDEYFSSNLGLPTAVAEPLPLFKVSVDKSIMAKFLVVLGLARIAFGDRAHTINFLERKEKDWIPHKQSLRHINAKSIETSAKIAKTHSHLSSRLRVIILICLFVVCLLALVGVYSWKKSGSFFGWPGFVKNMSLNQAQIPMAAENPLQLIVRPASKSQSLSFVIPVSLDAASIKPGEYAGTIESIDITKTMSYTSEMVDMVRRTFQEQLNDVPTDDEMSAALTDKLVQLLWAEEYDANNNQQMQKGGLLLYSFIDKIVDTGSMATEYDEANKTTNVNLHVTYRALSLANKAAYDSLELQNIDAFMKKNPGMELVKQTYAFYDESPANITVVASFVFEKP